MAASFAASLVVNGEAAEVGIAPAARLGAAAGLERAAEAWARDAHPLAGSGWKVDAAGELIRRALRHLGRTQ